MTATQIDADPRQAKHWVFREEATGVAATVTAIPTRRTHRAQRAQRGLPHPLPCDGPRAGSGGGGLTARGRFVVALAWVGLAVLGAWATVAAVVTFGSGGTAPESYSGPTTTVSVDPGETLWGVVGELDTDVEPEVVMAQIVELNQLSSSADLDPGDVLVVPSAS